VNLLLDIGNSRVKWALAQGERLVETGVIRREDSPSWTDRLPRDSIDGLFVASVAHDSALEALAMHARTLGVPLQTIKTAPRFGDLINGYHEPEKLGVDRWMACIAARAQTAGSALVADVGTALTLDWIGADGQHGGGLITPGIGSMRAALRATTQLRPEHLPAIDTWLTQDTASAIAAGTLRSVIALLDGAAAELAPDTLLITGGEAHWVIDRLAADWMFRPQLVIEGLARAAAQSQRDCGSSQIASSTG
jgi:type III pantothenate kinase